MSSDHEKYLEHQRDEDAYYSERDRADCYAQAHALIVGAASDAGFNLPEEGGVGSLSIFLGNLEQRIAAAIIGAKGL